MRLKDQHRAASSQRRSHRNVGEAELVRVLQRRRRAIGEGGDRPFATQTEGKANEVPRNVIVLFLCGTTKLHWAQFLTKDLLNHHKKCWHVSWNSS